MNSINGKFRVDVIDYHRKANKKRDGSTAFVDVEMVVEKEKAAERFGEGFEQFAFGSRREVVDHDKDKGDATEIRYMQDKVKPSGWYKKSAMHKLHVADLPLIELQPLLLFAGPIQKTDKAIVAIRLEIPGGRGDLLRFLDSAVGGETVSLEFEPKQARFDFEVKEGGANTDNEAASAQA